VNDFWFSMRLFVWGVLRRFYLMLPPLLLDPFDLISRLSAGHYDPNPNPTVTWTLFYVGLFFACVLAYREAITGERQDIEVRHAARYLSEHDLTSGQSMRSYSLSWLFFDLRNSLGGIGVDTRNFPRSSLGPVDWKGVLATFDRVGLVKSQHFHPDMAHAYQVWQLSDLGGRLLQYLEKHPPAEPISLGQAAMNRIRFFKLRMRLYPILPQRWRFNSRFTRRD